MDRPDKPAVPPAFERHFTAKELAEEWHMGKSTIFDLFANEPGAVRLGSRSTRKRTRLSLRIPLSVAKRVYERLQVR